MASPEQNGAGPGYEVSDVRTNVVTVFLVFVAVLTVLALVAVILVIRGFEAGHARGGEAASPLDGPFAELPEPGVALLQQNPGRDRRAIVEAAQAQLNSYGISKEAGVENGADVVSIPIARAIELVGSGKAPYRQKPVAAAIEQADGGEAKP